VAGEPVALHPQLAQQPAFGPNRAERQRTERGLEETSRLGPSRAGRGRGDRRGHAAQELPTIELGHALASG
jgi:hypothetical protein